MTGRFASTVLSLREFASNARRVLRDSLFGPRIMEGIARVGYAARGVVYLLIGWLAAISALSDSRLPTLAGALSTVSDLRAGGLLVAAIALGLFAYAVWRLAQAVLDLSNHGWRAKGLLLRGSMLVDAMLHAGLGVLAAVIALGWAGLIRGEAAMAEAWAELALDWPLGHWIVGLIGLGTVAMGFGQVAKAHRTAFEDIQAAEKAMTVIRIIGRTGLAAKGLILTLIGVFFLMAAWRVDAAAAGGLRAALLAVAALPLGNSVLLGVSAGLAVYGAFGVIKGWCHKRPNV